MMTDVALASLAKAGQIDASGFGHKTVKPQAQTCESSSQVAIVVGPDEQEILGNHDNKYKSLRPFCAPRPGISTIP